MMDLLEEVKLTRTLGEKDLEALENRREDLLNAFQQGTLQHLELREGLTLHRCAMAAYMRDDKPMFDWIYGQMAMLLNDYQPIVTRKNCREVTLVQGESDEMQAL